MQSQQYHIDVRIPALCAGVSAVSALAGYGNAELQLLASQQGFAGLTHVTPNTAQSSDVCQWVREMDFQATTDVRTLPIAAGLLAEGKAWRHKEPFSLGGVSKILAVLAVIGGAFVQFIGMKPLNEKVFYLMIAMLVVMAVCWFVFGERNRFEGSPIIKE